MTNPTTPPTNDRDAIELTKPLREPAALVLLAVNGMFLLLGVLDLLVTTDAWADGFGNRAAASYERFVGLHATVLPLLAVLLVTHIRPVPARAKLITVVALAEYAVSAFFGGLTYIAAFATDMSRVDGPSLGQLFENLLVRTLIAALFALAAFVVFRVWQGRYAPPRAPRQPAGYYGAPTPHQAPPGYPAPNYAPGYAQPGGQHPASTGWPQVPPPPAPAHPYAAPPQSAQPQSAPPAQVAPQEHGPLPGQPSGDSMLTVPVQPYAPEQPKGPVLPPGPTDRSEPAGPTITEKLD
ncbi:hypothetical protein [Luedemannella helvata]|uniref:Uncharacterized protein n=1 Tax=Luedemannella helvata TaxID=349315 RepID=A0ABP4W5J5_9ACTN